MKISLDITPGRKFFNTGGLKSKYGTNTLKIFWILVCKILTQENDQRG